MWKNYQALKAEDASPEYTGLSDQERCDTMNAHGGGTARHGITDTDELKRWMAKQLPQSLIATLRDYASNGADANAKAASAGLIELFDEGVQRFNLHNPKAQLGLSALVAAGVITQAQMDEAAALGDTPQTVANNCGFSTVYPNDLIIARAQ